MGKLDGHKIGNIQESFTNSVNVTSYPTEKGFPISDGVQRQPKTFSIAGKILGETDEAAKIIYISLEKKQNVGILMTYVGRMNAKNVIITNMSGSYDATIANGMTITIDLQEIRIANSPYAKKKTTVKQSGKKSISNTKKSKNVYHKVNKDDSYYKLSKKYGTSIAQLRAWNKYPDSQIPLNVKLRVQ